MDVTITLPFRSEHLSKRFDSIVCSIQYQTSDANYRRSRRRLHKSLPPEMSQVNFPVTVWFSLHDLLSSVVYTPSPTTYKSKHTPPTHLQIPGVVEHKRNSMWRVKRFFRFANLVFASNGSVLVENHNLAMVKLYPLLVEMEFFTIISSYD